MPHLGGNYHILLYVVKQKNLLARGDAVQG
jgi:hypothetical protein